jgi:hypothetical protein
VGFVERLEDGRRTLPEKERSTKYVHGHRRGAGLFASMVIIGPLLAAVGLRSRNKVTEPYVDYSLHLLIPFGKNVLVYFASALCFVCVTDALLFKAVGRGHDWAAYAIGVLNGALD